MVTLSDLVGAHEFSGIDFYAETEVSHAQVIRFVLDDIVYTAIEDPCDGYRSMLESLEVAESGVVKSGVVVLNTFRPHWVEARMSIEPHEDVLIFYDRFTGLPILTLGTSMINSYYPSFVCDYQPSNLMDNHLLSNHKNIIWIDGEL